MWKYDTIKTNKKKWKHWWNSNLRIMENVFYAASDSTNWAIQADIK